MIKKLQIVLIILTCFGLTACSSINKHFTGRSFKSDKAYLKAKRSPNLKVPSDLSREKVGDSYTVPPARSRGPVPVKITPPGGVYKSSVSGNPKEAKKKSGYFLKPLF